jgi:DNA polymerase III alpha subunit
MKERSVKTNMFENFIKQDVDDITDWVPVSTADDKETGEKMLVTQYEGSVIEDTGLIKMDFLGLKTLSIIKEAVANVRLHRGLELDIDKISISDPATYKLYCDGRTIGTFQFESAGMQKYLRELQPSTFEDLIAMNALYRPGPMDYIPDFIDRKWGRKPIEYDIPIMEKYLKDTWAAIEALTKAMRKAGYPKPRKAPQKAADAPMPGQAGLPFGDAPETPESAS